MLLSGRAGARVQRLGGDLGQDVGNKAGCSGRGNAQDRGHCVQLVSVGGRLYDRREGRRFRWERRWVWLVSWRCALQRVGRVQGSHSILRASCREHGGAAFELDAGSGLGQAGAALASDVVARRLGGWPHLRGRAEEGLRAARLDRFRGIGCIESCVGEILKFFKRTMLRRRSPTSKDSWGVLGLRGCGFWALEVPGHLIGLLDGLAIAQTVVALILGRLTPPASS